MLGLVVVGVIALAIGFVAALLWMRIKPDPARAEIETYRSQLLVAEHKASGLEQRLATAKSELADLREQRRVEGSTATARIAELQAQLQNAQSSVGALTTDAAALKHTNELLLERALQAENKVSALESTLAALQDQLKAQKGWVEEQTAHFREQVQNFTSQILEDKSVKLTALNAEQLGEILNPFREQLGNFKKRIDEVADTGARDHTALRTELGNMQALTKSIVDQTSNLTNALTHSAKAQGDWGEMILRRALEQSGLRKNSDYKLQCDVQAADDEATRRQRPDAVIFMPEDRQMVIDAKVSLTAWQEYTSATDKELKGNALKRHLQSLRTHVRDLADRDYSLSPDLKAVDFTVMFVPIEGALLEALQADFGIYEDAFRRKVILVSPTTVFTVLKLVEGFWRIARREQDAVEVIETGRKLYEKLCTFAESFDEALGSISKAKDHMERAKGQLTTGRGNAMKHAQDLLGLGVSTQKRLPKGYAPDSIAAEADQPESQPLPPLPAADGATPATPH